MNPFEYGGAVGPDAYCGRQREQADLMRAVTNGEHHFVYADRRMGKTSLARCVLNRLDPQRYVTVFVDLWLTDGAAAFVDAMATALTGAAASRADKLLDVSKQLFSGLRPSLTLDKAGNPSLQFETHAREGALHALSDVLAAPSKVAEKYGRRVVIVFDEFQQLLEYEDDLVERLLRLAVQQSGGVVYLFLGGRKYLIERMFLEPLRPLYRLAEPFLLGPIAVEHWVPFIRERFEQAERPITEDQVEALCAITEGHPFYTQHLAHVLWERTPMGAAVEQCDLPEAIEFLLRRESTAFAARWEALTKNQQRFLRGLATEAPGVAAFSAEFVQAYRLKTPSNAQRAAEALLKLELIDRKDGSFVVTDRFFGLWLRRPL